MHHMINRAITTPDGPHNIVVDTLIHAYQSAHGQLTNINNLKSYKTYASAYRGHACESAIIARTSYTRWISEKSQFFKYERGNRKIWRTERFREWFACAAQRRLRHRAHPLRSCRRTAEKQMFPLVKDPKFEIGDQSVALHARRRQSRYFKWESLHTGPFVITGHTGTVNFQLRHIPEKGLDQVEHADKLKKCCMWDGDETAGQTDSAAWTDRDTELDGAGFFPVNLVVLIHRERQASQIPCSASTARKHSCSSWRSRTTLTRHTLRKCREQPNRTSGLHFPGTPFACASHFACGIDISGEIRTSWLRIRKRLHSPQNAADDQQYLQATQESCGVPLPGQVGVMWRTISLVTPLLHSSAGWASKYYYKLIIELIFFKIRVNENLLKR